MPNWTYIWHLHCVPYFCWEEYHQQDPIDLIFLGADITTVANSLLNRGWHDVQCQVNEYIYWNNAWKVQDVAYQKDEQGWCGGSGTRKHIRLWALDSSTVLAGVHLDHAHFPDHIVHDYELVEHSTADDMRLTDSKPWRVQEDNHWMNNYVDYVHDDVTVHNDGYATVVRLQTGATARITDGLTPTRLEIANWGGIREFDNHQVQVYSISGTVRWSLWYSSTYTSGSVASGGVSTISYTHWTAWIMTVWLEDVSSSDMGAIMCKENDHNSGGSLGCITLSGGFTANVGDSVPNTLLDVRSFGGVRDTGVSTDNRRVVVYSSYSSDVVEWGLWHQGTYLWGEASAGSPSYATFPDAKFFIIIIARPYQASAQYSEGDSVGVLLCREDNNILGCMTHATGRFVSLSNGAPDMMNQIGAIGGIRDISTEPSDPNPHILELYASSGSTAVEGAVWYNGVYSPGDTPYGGTKQLNFPHYTAFVSVAARYDKLIWLFCKENDSVWECAPFRWFP